MTQKSKIQENKGTFIFGIIIIGVVAVRGITYYWGLTSFLIYATLLILFSAFYFISLYFPDRLARFRLLYFSLQTVIIFVLVNLQPALDITNLLFITLSMQVVHIYSGRAVIGWIVLYTTLLTITMILGQGLIQGLILSLFFLAGGVFVVSYDLLYLQAREDQNESQVLLSELQDAHQKLKDYAAQAEELATERERNRIARELHDSVSQLIFSIILTARSAQSLLEKDPSRLPEQFDHLEEMTSSALNQLRSLIVQLRPPANP
jgi:signal transduction histidine kinase